MGLIVNEIEKTQGGLILYMVTAARLLLCAQQKKKNEIPTGEEWMDCENVRTSQGGKAVVNSV